MKNRMLKVAVLFAAALALAACATTAAKKGEEAQAGAQGATAGGQAGAPGATTQGVGEGGEFQGSPLDNPQSPLYKRTIYFDFDKSDIKPEYRPIVEAHAKYLADHPTARVRLEGNTDERGTREYNLALGERRAKAVEQMMTLYGASAQQIQTVSYGEERPVDPAHNEAAWAKNRRVDIVYLSR